MLCVYAVISGPIAVTDMSHTIVAQMDSEIVYETKQREFIYIYS